MGSAAGWRGAVRVRRLYPETITSTRGTTITTATTTNPIAITDFVRRQTPESRFGHFDGDIEELTLVEDHVVVKDEPDLRIVSLVDTSRFRSSVVAIDPDSHRLRVDFESRQEGEERLANFVATGGEKGPSGHVELVLYSREALAKEGIEIDRKWGLVSINCSPTDRPTPMRPETMARNMLEMEGGTKREYTAEDFAESVWFWSRFVMIEPDA